MRKLSLNDYTVSIRDQKGITGLVTYQFKDTLANLITHPKLGLNGRDLLEVAPLVEKIEKANTEVILNDEEYFRIISVLKRFTGFIKNDIQFVRRIYNCPVIPNDDKIIELSEN